MPPEPTKTNAFIVRTKERTNERTDERAKQNKQTINNKRYLPHRPHDLGHTLKAI
jgi:hypothetical protein